MRGGKMTDLDRLEIARREADRLMLILELWFKVLKEMAK